MSHGNCHGCGNIICSTYGCQRWKTLPVQPGYYMPPPVTQGCICPPTSEQTCQNPRCPRQPPKELTLQSGTQEPRT
jgi:hypothetical protein